MRTVILYQGYSTTSSQNATLATVCGSVWTELKLFPDNYNKLKTVLQMESTNFVTVRWLDTVVFSCYSERTLKNILHNKKDAVKQISSDASTADLSPEIRSSWLVPPKGMRRGSTTEKGLLVLLQKLIGT